MEALFILVVHQLNELQPPGVIQSKGLRQLPGGVFVPGPGAAVVQLVGENQIEGLNVRTVPEKFLNFRQVDAPLHIEHQHTQSLWDGLRRRNEIVGLRLPELGDLGHDLFLGALFQKRPQRLAFFQRDFPHSVHSFSSFFRQVERMISSG